jgi:hypothetical protein
VRWDAKHRLHRRSEARRPRAAKPGRRGSAARPNRGRGRASPTILGLVPRLAVVDFGRFKAEESLGAVVVVAAAPDDEIPSEELMPM